MQQISAGPAYLSGRWRQGIQSLLVTMAKNKKARPAPAGSNLDVVADYRFPEATRKNNPPAKIAAEGHVPLVPKAEYTYSARRPPELRFDPTGRPDELLHIRVEHAFLLQIVRHGVLRQKRCLEPDFSPNPLTFGVGSVGWMIASPATAKLRPEVLALNLLKLVDVLPRRIADGSGHVNLEFQYRHENKLTTEN